MTEIKYKVGQQVVIKRNLGARAGRDKNEYYYGMSVRIIPLGTKAKIKQIAGSREIYVRIGNSYDSWYMHPDEIAIDEKADREMMDRLSPKLDSILLLDAPTVKEIPKGKKPFNPRFNAKEEFAAWVREEFPTLGKYSTKSKNYYISLGKRKDEVQEAAQLAWKGMKNRSQRCHSICLEPIFERLSSTIEDTQKYAKALENFVKAIELSGQQGFPHNREKDIVRLGGRQEAETMEIFNRRMWE